MVLNDSKTGVFPVQPIEDAGRLGMLPSLPLELSASLIILSPKQMLQRLPMSLAQVKAGNTCK